MRLSKMKDVIDSAVMDLEINSDGNVLLNISRLQSCLNQLHSIGVFNTVIDQIYPLLPPPNLDNSAALAPSVMTQLSSRVGALKSQITIANRVIENASPLIKANDILLKLPNHTRIHDVYEDLEKMDSAFVSILSEAGIENDITFKGVESGSAWIILGIGAATFVPLLIILKCARAIHDFRADLELKTMRMNAEGRSLQTQTKLNEAIQVLIEENIRGLGDECGKSLGVDIHAPENTEKMNRIIYNLKQLGEIFDKGGRYEVPRVTYEEGNVREDILPEKIAGNIADLAVKAFLPKD